MTFIMKKKLIFVPEYEYANNILSFVYKGKEHLYDCSIFDLMSATVHGVIDLSKLKFVRKE